MSKGSVGATGKFIPKKYFNLKLEPKDWCGYFKGICNITNNINDCYCWTCKYRKDLDIPDLLAERGKIK